MPIVRYNPQVGGGSVPQAVKPASNVAEALTSIEIGNAVANIGQGLVDRATKLQDDFNKAKAMDLNNQFEMAINQKLTDAENAKENQGLSANGYTSRVKKDIGDTYAKFKAENMAGLPEEVSKYFDLNYGNILNSATDRAAKFEYAQLENGQKVVFMNTQNAALESIAAAPDNKDNIKIRREQIAMQAWVTFKDPNAAELAVKEYDNKVDEVIFESLKANRDIKGLQAFAKEKPQYNSVVEPLVRQLGIEQDSLRVSGNMTLKYNVNGNPEQAKILLSNELTNLTVKYNDKAKFDELKKAYGLTGYNNEDAFQIIETGYRTAYQNANRRANDIAAARARNEALTQTSVNNFCNGIVADVISGKITPQAGVSALGKFDTSGAKYSGTARLTIENTKQGLNQYTNEITSAKNVSWGKQQISRGASVEPSQLFAQGLISKEGFMELDAFKKDTKVQKLSSQLMNHIKNLAVDKQLTIGDEIYDNAMDILSKNPDEGASIAFGKAYNEAVKNLKVMKSTDGDINISRGARQKASEIPFENRLKIARMINEVKSGKITPEDMTNYIESLNTTETKSESKVTPDKTVKLQDVNDKIGLPVGLGVVDGED